MEYRRLGETGLRVSCLGFGTIPILKGSVPVLPEYYNLEVAQALEVMLHAYRLGCNFYDTAIVPEYGDAEIKLGKFAKLVDRNTIVISDKARFFDGNTMYQAVEESVRNLQDIPDIYFVHQVDYDNVDEVLGKYGAMEALSELKREGKIRFTGIASHYYDVLYRSALDSRVDVLQMSGNVLECGMLMRVREESVFRKKGIVLNKVYAAGLLPKYFTVRDLIQNVLTYPISTALIGLGSVEQVDSAIGSIGEDSAIRSVEQVNSAIGSIGENRAMGSVEQVDSAIGSIGENRAIGSVRASTEQMDSYMECARQSTPIDLCNCSDKNDNLQWEKVISRLQTFYEPIPCDRCQRCICPYGTEIHTVFRQYNYFNMGKDYWALKKLNLGIEESAANCEKCTHMPCMKQCPHKLFIPKIMQEINDLVKSYL